MERPQERRTSSNGIAVRKDKGKPLVRDLNEHITCPLCRGYLIDATTLVECLHSFCRGCITRRFCGGPKTCPVCNVTALAPSVTDIGLQRLIYLVVPGLLKSEQERRRIFCQINPQCTNLNQIPIGAPDLTFDDLVSLSLSELGSNAGDGSTRYLKCVAGVTVKHLMRLLMLKRGWDNVDGVEQLCVNNKIEIMYEVKRARAKVDYEVLNPSWTLMDLACIFQWKSEAPMKLLYRIVRLEDSTMKSLGYTSNLINNITDANNQAIENIQRPPTPPPSPKPAISRADLDKNQYSKEFEAKKPRCEVTPVLRAPGPHYVGDSAKSGKSSKLEHHKRKKKRNKHVIAEITTTPREDLLKLKVRLTPIPPKVTSSHEVHSKDQLAAMKIAKKDKTKSNNPEKHKLPKERKVGPKIVEIKHVTSKEDLMKTKEVIKVTERNKTVSNEKKVVANAVTEVDNSKKETDEPPKNEEVLRRLGLVAISEANKTRLDKAKDSAQSNPDKKDPAAEREKLEKQLRESKANRVRSLLAEKQMRDTLKSIMSNSKDTNSTNNTTMSTSSSSLSATPTTVGLKRKDPPPLTPLRNNKKPNVTFAPNSFPGTKHESPLDLSSPSLNSKNNVLDLSSGISEVQSSKLEIKPVGILRNSRPLMEKSKEDGKKTHDTNLRTLSDAAVSLLGGPQSAKISQNFLGGGSNVAGKVALRIPQPHQRISGFKFKPNIGVRHIPNPQAVVASQYRNQRTAGYYNLVQQPP